MTHVLRIIFQFFDSNRYGCWDSFEIQTALKCMQSNHKIHKNKIFRKKNHVRWEMNVHTFFDTQNEIHIIYLMCDFKLIFTINESVGILSKFNNVSISFYICAHNYESTLVTKMKKKMSFSIISQWHIFLN